jgi:hypothetical protein
MHWQDRVHRGAIKADPGTTLQLIMPAGKPVGLALVETPGVARLGCGASKTR